ncbi:MAG TPA: bifunctional 4-hydroxy-2-oxoglutarate aldolase/2-dehydro-3-deoxy-phosphogluconate aldolase [Actinomycetota bacterium]|nr:bifunctional 4-hydroxy-2-oxoglutarate aldolase/2-dehydro-3-deoxy-phosphogluconate aldolase [Actinomycetota bacterium]
MIREDVGRLIAVVRYRTADGLDRVLGALADAGVPALEITLDTPGALDAIARAAERGDLVGAGTVLSADQVGAAADAGARFVASPHLVPAVVDAATARGIDAFPGVLTPGELARALEAGARAVKLFPAAAVGPAYVRTLRGPYPDVPIVPTGGIAIADVRGYLAAGATAVGLGSSLVGAVPPADDLGMTALRDRAREAVAATRG